MKERPIPFSAPMVRAILEGRKTMTRRVTWLEHINQAPDHWYIDAGGLMADRTTGELMGINGPLSCRPYDIMCSYGQPGDRLWVKETWADIRGMESTTPGMLWSQEAFYKAQRFSREESQWLNDNCIKWRSPRFMPRWASRILLEVTAVRVERVQEIDSEDCIREGIPPDGNDGITENGLRRQCDLWEEFQILWDSINAKRGYGWDANPWVWVVEFKRVEAAS